MRPFLGSLDKVIRSPYLASAFSIGLLDRQQKAKILRIDQNWLMIRWKKASFNQKLKKKNPPQLDLSHLPQSLNQQSTKMNLVDQDQVVRNATHNMVLTHFPRHKQRALVADHEIESLIWSKSTCYKGRCDKDGKVQSFLLWRLRKKSWKTSRIIEFLIKTNCCFCGLLFKNLVSRWRWSKYHFAN